MLGQRNSPKTQMKDNGKLILHLTHWHRKWLLLRLWISIELLIVILTGYLM
jgi:hypothetical protein